MTDGGTRTRRRFFTVNVPLLLIIHGCTTLVAYLRSVTIFSPINTPVSVHVILPHFFSSNVGIMVHGIRYLNEMSHVTKGRARPTAFVYSTLDGSVVYRTRLEPPRTSLLPILAHDTTVRRVCLGESPRQCSYRITCLEKTKSFEPPCCCCRCVAVHVVRPADSVAALVWRAYSVGKERVRKGIVVLPFISMVTEKVKHLQRVVAPYNRGRPKRQKIKVPRAVLASAATCMYILQYAERG